MKVGVITILVFNSLFCIAQNGRKTVDFQDKLRIFYIGLENRSTSPSYVSFKAVDKQTKKERTICCLAPSINLYFSKGSANIVDYLDLTIEIDSLEAKYPCPSKDTLKCSKNGYDLYAIDDKEFYEFSSNFGNTLIEFSNRLAVIERSLEEGKLKRKQRINLEREMASIGDSIKTIDKKSKSYVPHFYFNYGISTRADCIDGSIIVENKLKRLINASP